jgi:hypothetical protein
MRRPNTSTKTETPPMQCLLMESLTDKEIKKKYALKNATKTLKPFVHAIR